MNKTNTNNATMNTQTCKESSDRAAAAKLIENLEHKDVDLAALSLEEVKRLLVTACRANRQKRTCKQSTYIAL